MHRGRAGWHQGVAQVTGSGSQSPAPKAWPATEAQSQTSAWLWRHMKTALLEPHPGMTCRKGKPNDGQMHFRVVQGMALFQVLTEENES